MARVKSKPAPPPAPDFVEPRSVERIWDADREVIETRCGRRIVRESVGRRVVPPRDHSAWLYSAWEPIINPAAYGLEVDGWGRIDRRGPAPARIEDFGELIDFEFQQRRRALRLIVEYCPETRFVLRAASTDRPCMFAQCGQVMLWTEPRAALAEALKRRIGTGGLPC